MEVIIIVAMSLNRVIGRGLAIPWHIPDEQLRFKKITMGHTLIMGRKTFEAIGRSLPGRRNVIVSRNKKFRAKGCEVVLGLESAFSLCEDNEKVFVIGGEQIFKQAMSMSHSIILTTIQRQVEGDVFFPLFTGFDKISIEKVNGPDPYTVDVFTRKKPGTGSLGIDE